MFRLSENVYIVMYGFLHDYVKPKQGQKAKLCYMDTGSFIVYMKTEDIYPVISKYVKTRFDASILNQTDHYLKEKTESCWISEK